MCSIVDCNRPVRARGWCVAHYNRWRRTGNPGPAELLSAQLRTGQLHPRWSTEPSYDLVHQRLRQERGQATSFPCSSCESGANSWAYDHKDEHQRIDDDRGRPYSTDPAHYVALCWSCHTKFDHAEAKAGAIR